MLGFACNLPRTVEAQCLVYDTQWGSPCSGNGHFETLGSRDRAAAMSRGGQPNHASRSPAPAATYQWARSAAQRAVRLSPGSGDRPRGDVYVVNTSTTASRSSPAPHLLTQGVVRQRQRQFTIPQEWRPTPPGILRRGLHQPPHPEVHRQRHLPDQWGCSARQRPVERAHRRGDDAAATSTSRTHSTTASRSSPAPAAISPSGARRSGNGHSILPAECQPTLPLTSSSRHRNRRIQNSPDWTYLASGARRAAAMAVRASQGSGDRRGGAVYVVDIHRIQSSRVRCSA